MTTTPDIVTGWNPDFNGQPPAHTWQPQDLVALGSQPPEPPGILGVLYSGRRHLLSGENEALKSWVMLVACVEEICAGRTVVYVDYENGSREILARLHDLGLDDITIRERFVYLEPDEPMTDPLVAADVDTLLAQKTPSLVAIDAYTGALGTHGLDPNSGLDIEKFDRTVIGRLRAHGAATITADHLAKDKDKRGRYSIGSERKASACDVHLGAELVRPFARGRSGLVKLKVHKDRPGFLPRPTCGELELTSDPGTRAITWTIRPAEHADDTAGSFRPTVLMERVSDYLERQAAPVTRRRIAEDVTGNRQYKFAAISHLISEGYASENTDGGIISEKPFRDAQDG